MVSLCTLNMKFTANNKIFHYRINSWKINDQIFLYIQKALFWPIVDPYPQFWGAKKVLPKHPAL